MRNNPNRISAESIGTLNFIGFCLVLALVAALGLLSIFEVANTLTH